MKRAGKIAALLLAAAQLAVITPSAWAEGAAPAQSNNTRGLYGGYGARWSTPILSHLYQDGDDLIRVERIGSDVVVETYDSSFALQDSRTITPELPLWGGFYAGEDYNFLITGQNNEEEDDGKEVILVTRYDKNWNEVDHVGLFGANTIHPFDAGSLSCDEYGGYLYVRTCHEMYTSGDGLNHQSNLTFCVRISDMTITDSFFGVANSSAGYVSHSFNQHILVDGDGYVVALDHGDAYPRGVLLSRYKAKAGSDKFITASGSHWGAVDKAVTLAAFSGSVGANATGGMTTDLAETSTGYLAAFTDTGLGDRSSSDSPADVYLAWTDKGNVSDAGTTVRKITSVSDGTTAKNAYIVPTGEDGGWLVWESQNSDGVSLQYVSYAADGSVGAVASAAGDLSNCHPILYQGKATWYVTTSSAPVFYTLDDSGVTAHPVGAAEPDPTPAPTPTPTPSSTSFTDVDATHWAYSSIQEMADAGVMKGTGDGMFSPGATITGAEFATMLVRAYWPAAYEQTAADGQGAAWWSHYYQVLDSKQGLDGAAGVIADPESPMTRQDMMHMIYNVLSAKDKLTSDLDAAEVMSQFLDYPQFQDDAQLVERCAQVAQAGILNGKDGGYFALADQLTRAEAATVMSRMLKQEIPSDQ